MIAANCRPWITVQMQVSEWHGYLGDPMIAHAILDRLASRSMRSHRVAMPNESA